MTLINHSPTTTRSLDRKRSKPANQHSPSISIDQRKSSLTTIKTPILPPKKNSSSKQNDLPTNNRINSNKVKKSQSFETE